MENEIEIAESGLLSVEFLTDEIHGYQKGSKTVLEPHVAAGLEKAGHIKVIAKDKRPMRKIAPAAQAKADVEGAEGSKKTEGVDEKSGKSK